jgi:hypothetical protein
LTRGPAAAGPRPEARVSLRWRLVLAMAGLALFCLAATVLVYRWWPLGVTHEEFQPAPTLFAPPAARSAGDGRA